MIQRRKNGGGGGGDFAGAVVDSADDVDAAVGGAGVVDRRDGDGNGARRPTTKRPPPPRRRRRPLFLRVAAAATLGALALLRFRSVLVSSVGGRNDGGRGYDADDGDASSSVASPPRSIAAPSAVERQAQQRRPPSPPPDDDRRRWARRLSESTKFLRSEFETRYGGRDVSSAMLDRGVRTHASTRHESIRRTAERILRSAASASTTSSPDGGKDRFVMSFGGYSVTVGRGNYFRQSFPFVVSELLSPLFQLMGLELIVRNAAIGGIPSFPYGWCLSHFLGKDVDVVGWDYGMNEGNGAGELESYVRNAIATSSSDGKQTPMMIVLDDKRSRMDLLRRYVESGALDDPISVKRANGGVVDRSLLNKPEEERPEGLRDWDEWGAPRGSPGQSQWHPKYREHELLGWMISMHFVEAFEEAVRTMERDPNWRDARSPRRRQPPGRTTRLPKPIAPIESLGENADAVASMLYGRPSGDENGGGSWTMNGVSCRTSFRPAADPSSPTLTSIVVSGVVAPPSSSVGDEDLLKPLPDESYSKGWTLDVGDTERKTKIKVSRVNGGRGMGYVDMKAALYGVKASGTLKLWLPYEGAKKPRPSMDATADKGELRKRADRWFSGLVVCEVNEKRGPKECDLERDVRFVVGHSEASTATAGTTNGVRKIRGAANYLNKAVCVNVPIPPGAEVSARPPPPSEEDDASSAKPPPAAGAGSTHGTDDDVGLTLEISVVSDKVTRKDGACSISHVVWEHR